MSGKTIFVTGANGFVGLHTVRELLQQGYRVLALARSDSGADKIKAFAGSSSEDVTIVRGSTADHALLQRTAARSDGIVHLAYNHDFAGVDRDTAAKEDDAAQEALMSGLREKGTDLPLVAAAGIILRQGTPGAADLSPLGEDERPVPEGPAGARAKSCEALVSAPGIRGIAMRFPPSVHGKGDNGFVPALCGAIAQNKRALYFGEGANRWSTTHVTDVASALVLALEKGPRGYLHAIAEEGVAFKDIVKDIGAKLGVQAESADQQEFDKLYTWLSDFAAMDAPATSHKTKEVLGWQPKGPTLAQDLAEVY